MSPLDLNRADHHFFALRELAVTRAIELGRARLDVNLFECPAVQRRRPTMQLRELNPWDPAR